MKSKAVTLRIGSSRTRSVKIITETIRGTLDRTMMKMMKFNILEGLKINILKRENKNTRI